MHYLDPGFHSMTEPNSRDKFYFYVEWVNVWHCLNCPGVPLPGCGWQWMHWGSVFPAFPHSKKCLSVAHTVHEPSNLNQHRRTCQKKKKSGWCCSQPLDGVQLDSINDTHLCGKTKAQSSLHLSSEIRIEISVLFLKEKPKKSINSLWCVHSAFYMLLCSFNFSHILSFPFINNLTSFLNYYI